MVWWEDIPVAGGRGGRSWLWCRREVSDAEYLGYISLSNHVIASAPWKMKNQENTFSNNKNKYHQLSLLLTHLATSCCVKDFIHFFPCSLHTHKYSVRYYYYNFINEQTYPRATLIRIGRGKSQTHIGQILCLFSLEYWFMPTSFPTSKETKAFGR